ncbi:1,2-phenylacetyl-CoA epoxidase subunit PaaD [Rivibacter subsaxonicus]|uniref:Ring-1,2-phenylacetyl-CoA epoxidase subunit PaaD n=1 Tax=Rivibacter subsaxonicus TaxID=457575 RepID=A0A4Q7VP12_9BURK|nr:1,2-phenylacetyl-CoA epoxidase subunit PaaD [Rivibacter subsaxonicus]RZT98146.1 ring-1,2-phenylacetyl-CoA epoxidase subunit PaaD [Rivibacter subsaxonicus]
MVAARPAVETVWQWLSAVLDPEIPVISVVELGIVREVAWREESLVVTVTPTYSGCPATEVISADIEGALRAHGIEQVRIETRLAPAWTTDWLAEPAREKLRAFGIAPPGRRDPPLSPTGPTQRPGRVLDIRSLDAEAAPVCPHCGSAHTRLVSGFGSTPCKSAHVCNDCLEPFERFKCH